MSKKYGATNEQGVIEIILCWTVNSEEGGDEVAAKAAAMVSDQLFNFGAWSWFDGMPVQQQVYVYRNPNGTYTVYVGEDEDAYGHFGF